MTSFKETRGSNLRFEDVELYDLVLTSSARLLVLTGDVNYRDNYFMKIEPLEDRVGL